LLLRAFAGLCPYDGRFHFDSLAHDNDADKSDVLGIVVHDSPLATSTPAPIILTGLQMVAKYNRTAPDKVEIKLALYRLEAQQIDLVVTANVPHVLADGSITPPHIIEDVDSVFESVARSLAIADFGLFSS
jgi:hypothetical protein